MIKWRLEKLFTFVIGSPWILLFDQSYFGRLDQKKKKMITLKPVSLTVRNSH